VSHLPRTTPRRGEAVEVRAVGVLRDQGQVVATPQARDQAPRPPPAAARGHLDQFADVGIAAQHGERAAEAEDVDRCLGPALPRGVDQRRRQQHVAKLARADHDDPVEAIVARGRTLRLPHRRTMSYCSGDGNGSARSEIGLSTKSMMMMPPRLRRRSCRAIACPGSRLVLKIVSSKLRAPTKPPVLTSTVVSASVWSMSR